jgi:nucleotide-binding universal stress UspA family protein
MNSEAAAASRLVLAAIDRSRNSILAAGAAARLAHMLGARLGLVHVLEALPLNFWAGVEQRMKEEIRAEAEATLSYISERVKAVCDVPLEYYIVEGEPETQIRDIVDGDPRILILVMGRNGLATERRARPRLGRSLGRLSGKLAADLHIPVLIVPPDAPTSSVCPGLLDPDQLPPGPP